MTNMLPPETPQQPAAPRSDQLAWAPRISTLRVGQVPTGAVNLNVDGRRVVGPLQGFGQLWQKTYRARLEGVALPPAEVVRIWKAEFASFHPPQNRFFTPSGVAPGDVVLINAALTGLPISTGVMVLYADDESFTLMTPQGHPESGWITFSAYEEDGVTICQIQSMARANDPIYEIGFRFFASRQQEQIWTHVLTALGRRLGVEPKVEIQKVLVDPRMQWREVRNVWQNAAVRSVIFAVSRPVRWVGGRLRKR